MNKYTELFGYGKPVIAMLHLFGDTQEDILERAKREIDIYYQCGVNAVLVENYGPRSGYTECDVALRYLKMNYPDRIYGLNMLDSWRGSFSLAASSEAKFIQIDSVSGHLGPRSDRQLSDRIESLKSAHCNLVVLGGVRFKYQPIESGRTLGEDLAHGIQRCDAIVVTGGATAMETPRRKLTDFSRITCNFPLVVGAGVTVENVRNVSDLASGFIVGSWFKDFHETREDVNPDYVSGFMTEVKRLRNFYRGKEQFDDNLAVCDQT